VARWNPTLHPRGRKGLFITTGMHVRLPGGKTGVVSNPNPPGGTRLGIARVEVRDNNGRTTLIPADQIEEVPPPRGSAYDGSGNTITVGDKVTFKDQAGSGTVKSVNKNGSITVGDARAGGADKEVDPGSVRSWKDTDPMRSDPAPGVTPQQARRATTPRQSSDPIADELRRGLDPQRLHDIARESTPAPGRRRRIPDPFRSPNRVGRSRATGTRNTDRGITEEARQARQPSAGPVQMDPVPETVDAQGHVGWDKNRVPIKPGDRVVVNNEDGTYTGNVVRAGVRGGIVVRKDDGTEDDVRPPEVTKARSAPKDIVERTQDAVRQRAQQPDSPIYTTPTAARTGTPVATPPPVEEPPTSATPPVLTDQYNRPIEPGARVSLFIRAGGVGNIQRPTATVEEILPDGAEWGYRGQPVVRVTDDTGRSRVVPAAGLEVKSTAEGMRAMRPAPGAPVPESPQDPNSEPSIARGRTTPPPARAATVPSSTGQPLAVGDRVTANGRTATITRVRAGGGRGGTDYVMFKADGETRERSALANRVTHADPAPAAPESTRDQTQAPYVGDEAREAFVTQSLADAREQGLETKDRFGDPSRPSGYTAEREAQQNAILQRLYEEASGVPNNRQALMSGGLGGAGKSYVLANHPDIAQDQYLTINADELKDELIKAGMAPDVPGLTPLEMAGLIHEESSDMSLRLAELAHRDGKNLIWDITMGSQGSVASRLAKLRENNYTVKGIFVSIPAEKSVESAMQRWRDGLDRFNAGEGLGGRYVPPDIIRSAADVQNARARSRNEDTFTQMRAQMDDWELWDNSQRNPDPALNRDAVMVTSRSMTDPNFTPVGDQPNSSVVASRSGFTAKSPTGETRWFPADSQSDAEKFAEGEQVEGGQATPPGDAAPKATAAQAAALMESIKGLLAL
jgi:predicted ABC-type ATPase